MPNPRSVLTSVVNELPDDWKMKSAGVPNFLAKKQIKPEELEYSGLNKQILAADKEPLTDRKSVV